MNVSSFFPKFGIHLNTITLTGASHVEYNRLLAEACKMIPFEHPNVIPLIGVVLGQYEEVPHLILPYMKNGNLLNHLKANGQAIPVNELLVFCLEVAQGLDYLANNNIVHGDLSCPNYLIDDHYHVVISDFGLTIDTDVNGYYVSKRSSVRLRHAAPECMAFGIFTTQSDIWSYGISAWEILTRGFEPYAHLEDILNNELVGKLQDLLASGYRLLQPEHCPPSIYQLMLSCWNLNRNFRPTPEEIAVQIRHAIQEYQQLDN